MERFRYNDEQEEDGRDKRTTSASSCPSWDGQLEKFPAFSVSLKSYARKKNLYKVMMKGTKPLHMTLQKPQDPDRDWWTFENDLTGVMGPRSGPEIIDNLKMFTTHCSFYGPATNQTWVYMSEQLIEAIKSSFMSSSIQTPATRLGRDIARRIQQAGLQTPSLQTDQEDDDEDDYSTEKDEKCYDMIVGTISLKQTTGEEMVLAIDEMFGDNPSGYKLYLWLCARGKFDSDQLGTGIIDANATRLEVEQFKIPSGKLTPEVLDTAQRSFVRLFCKQPEGRQGIKGDMTVAWFEKLPKIPFHEAASNTAHVPILELIKTFNLAQDNTLYEDFERSGELLRKLYADHVSKHGAITITAKGTNSTSTALVADYGGRDYGKGKGRGGRGRGQGRGGPPSWAKNFDCTHVTCYRCWKPGVHLSITCDKPAKTCTACGADGNVASCGGEYEPSKCMNKGYMPDPPPPATYLIKLKLHHDSGRLHAMLASQATVTQALVTQAPAPAAPPAGTDTTNGMTYGIEYDNDGVAFMVGRKALMMTDGMVLSAFGGRQAFPGEADVIMDSGCTTSGCVPSSHGLINLRSPEIDGLTVGNAEWCPAESTGDLVAWCINTDLSIKQIIRARHVVPGVKYHLAGEDAEFRAHGGTVVKGERQVIDNIDGTSTLLLRGADHALRVPLFESAAQATDAAGAIYEMHRRQIKDASNVLARHRNQVVSTTKGTPSATALLGASCTDAQADKWLQFHGVFGCMNEDRVRATLLNSTGHGFTMLPPGISKLFGECKICNSFKMTGVEHAAAGVHASQFGERVLVDDLGPFPVKCIVSGALYCRKYTDEATGMWAFYAVRQFTSEGTIQVTKEYMGDHSWLLPKAGTFRIFRTDNGSVLSSQKVRDYFDDEGATWEGSVPRDPKQMGQNEAAGRHAIVGSNCLRARARLAGKPCGKDMAILALQHYGDLHNHAVSTTWRGTSSPLQMATGRQPDLTRLHQFGGDMWSLLTKVERVDKLSEVSIQGQYIGLARSFKGVRMLITEGAQLSKAGLPIKPTVVAHSYTKIGLAPRHADTELARVGPSLLSPLFKISRFESSSTDGDGQGGAQPESKAIDQSNQQGGEDAQSHEKNSAQDEPKQRPRKNNAGTRPDGSKWSTRGTTAKFGPLLSDAIKANNTHAFLTKLAQYSEVAKPETTRQFPGAYSLIGESVKTTLLGDIPDSDWDSDDLYAIISRDDNGQITFLEDGMQRFESPVYVDFPGDSRSGLLLIAKKGDKISSAGQVPSGRATLAELLNHQDGMQWIKARTKEHEQLKSIPTWKAVKLRTIKAMGIKPVRTMFVDKVKKTSDNLISEFKSRGVACHFNAIPGVHYVHKYWYIARTSSIRQTLAKGTGKGVTLWQIDLPGFYLQAELSDANFDHEETPKIFIKMLPGFEEYDKDGDELCGELVASMYGTAPSGRAAGRKLTRDIVLFGGEQGIYDRATYRVADGDNGHWLEISVVVDDMIIADFGGTLIHKFKNFLEERWGSGRAVLGSEEAKPIKFGKLEFCLNLHTIHDEEQGIVALTGEQYIGDMVEKYLDEARRELISGFRCETPTDKDIENLTLSGPRQSKEAASLTRSVVQTLSYAAAQFAPQILYHVQMLQRFVDNPCDKVYECALQIVAHLEKYQDVGIAWSRDDVGDFGGSVKHFSDPLPAWGNQPSSEVDASWRVHDKARRSRSTTGLIYSWCNGPITAKSVGQRWQAISSTDAETYALSQAMYEGISIRGHAHQFGIDQPRPTNIKCDNLGGVQIANSEASMNRTRATAMRGVFMQECVERGMFKPTHVPGIDNTADILTKWLPANEFRKHRNKLCNVRAQKKVGKAKTA